MPKPILQRIYQNSFKTLEITEIKLKNTLPRVFENEPVPHSDVWKTDLTLKKGENYIIEAASGTGKSSLCAYIYGNRTDYAGDIFFNKKNIREFDINYWQQLRRTQIAYLPQELALFPELTALQNIEVKNSLTHHVSENKIHNWMKELGIDSRMHHPVGKMSIGQQQRVAIIRTLCQPFSFIFLDEPVSHLDTENNEIVAHMVCEEAEKQGAGIIATSVGNQLKIKTDNLLLL